MHWFRKGRAEEFHAGREANNTGGRGRPLEALPDAIGRAHAERASALGQASCFSGSHHTRPTTDPVVGHVDVEVGSPDKDSPVDAVGRQDISRIAVNQLAQFPNRQTGVCALSLEAHERV